MSRRKAGLPVEPQRDYLDRLADIDATIQRARLSPDAVVDRAAGLLAGRVGCRVSEAHTHLLQLASEQGRDPGQVAAEALTVLENQTAYHPSAVRDAFERALHPPHRVAAAVSRTTPPDAARPALGDWAAVVQQLLDGMTGQHAVLSPLRDETGEVDDYLIVAASPAATDMSGRRGVDLVGLHTREAYPASVGGPVWQACRATLADGAPREVGPFSYSGPAADVPAQLMITVRVRPVGAGLLNTWVRHDEQTRLAERIAQTERLGNLGWGEWDLISGKVFWSDGLYRIYERDPVDGPLSSAESEALALPEDEPIRRQAADSFGRGETIDLTYRIRIAGRIKHIRTVIDAVRDATGRPLKVYGILQDVTAREISLARLAAVEAQLREHQRSLAAEHQLAVQLQQIVLPIPEAPIDLPGLRVVVRYIPAEQASRVGGDWYHAGAGHDGSVVLAIGDVAGHGIHAAATMAQLRHALATLVGTTSTDPAELLAHLNRLLYAEGPRAGPATAVVARYDPTTRNLVWAQAGHLAPLHTHGSVTTPLDRPAGPILGAFPDASYATASITIQDRDLLLLYTDGLVEHRHRSLAHGLAPVIAALNRTSHTGSQQPLIDLLAQLPRANHDDDTCILAVRPLPDSQPTDYPRSNPTRSNAM
jgi:serine phosphatase RsbU (regulator of sigma subunit)/PAS domain-containing protein